MIKVEATAYSLTGSKGSISFKWKSPQKLSPNNKTLLIEAMEKKLASMFYEFEQSNE